MEHRRRLAIDDLTHAFPPRPLNADQAFGASGTTYLNADAFRDGSRGQTWDRLASEFLEFHHDATVFLTPEAFVEYLPAFLAAVLKGGPELNGLPPFLRSALTRSRDPSWFDARMDRLTAVQRSAVARALVALEESQTSRYDRQDYTEVLDEYWRPYLPEA